MGSFLPRRALLHPAWLIALGVLVLNDHVFKGANILPAVVTGKLSDLAGLFLAPALASTLLFARSRRGVFVLHALVAVAFAVVKTLPSATTALSHALSLVVASRVWTDPTDLVALPMVALSWHVLVPSMADASHMVWLRKAAQTAACVVGAVMCVATSKQVEAPLNVHNQTKQRVTLTVRRMSNDVQIDDTLFFSNTPLPLWSTLFSPTGGDGTLTIDPGGSVDSKTLGGRSILVEIPSAFGGKAGRFAIASASSVSSVDVVDGADGRITVKSDGAFIRDLDAVKPCAAEPLKGADISIALPSQKLGTIVLVGASSGPCFDVSFQGVTQPAHVCMPRSAWPFKEGDSLHIEGIDVVGVVGNVEHRLTFVTKPDPSKVTVDLSCGAVDKCGSIGFDTVLELPDGVTVRSGADHTAAETRWLVGRLESLPVVNTACSDAFGKTPGLGASLVRIETRPATQADAGADADAATDAATDAASD